MHGSGASAVRRYLLPDGRYDQPTGGREAQELGFMIERGSRACFGFGSVSSSEGVSIGLEVTGVVRIGLLEGDYVVDLAVSAAGRAVAEVWRGL